MTNIPEHDGKRLESLDRDELIALFKLRAERLVCEVGDLEHDYPGRRIGRIVSIVEVLNCITAMETQASSRDRAKELWPEYIVNITITPRFPK